MYRFLITATILVLLGFIYLGNRNIATEWPFAVQAAMWIVLGSMIANLLWLPFKRWRITSDRESPLRHPGAITKFFEASAYNLMGFLSMLLMFTALSEFVRVFLRFSPLWILAAAVLFFIWGRVAVVFGPRYKFVRLVYPLHPKPKRRPRFKKHSSPTQKIRITQVSDLHIGRAIKNAYVTKVVEMINKTEADFACFTGDIGDGSAAALAADAEPLAHIKTKHGTFYIPGNHEYYWGMQNWLKVFKYVGFIPLLNSGKLLQLGDKKIFLAGITDPTAGRFAEAMPQIPDREKSDLAILLAHQPIFAKSAIAKNYDLMLSGHTHGGQYIPWAWVVHLIYRFASGLYRTGNMLVYVNDGTGYWGAPVRLGTRLEITVLDIYFAD